MPQIGLVTPIGIQHAGLIYEPAILTNEIFITFKLSRVNY